MKWTRRNMDARKHGRETSPNLATVKDYYVNKLDLDVSIEI